MNKWLAIPDETKKNTYLQIAEKTGMSAFAVEKDWWVVQTLSVIFELKVADYLIFKGGTSLSKAWKIIKRFSEDIDFAIDRTFFNFEGELTKKEREKLRKASGKYIADKFFKDLLAKFADKGFTGLLIELVEEPESDKDRIINLYYPHVIATPGYLQPKIQIEISSRSLKEPFTIQSFGSLVDEAYPESNFAQAPIHVPTVNPERTFLEKIFLLHEEFQRPAHKMRVDRLSRHLYDIQKLAKTEFADKALNDKNLYEKLVVHRQKFNRVGGVDYNRHQPQTINPLPPSEVMEAWKADYKTMVEQMIYEDEPMGFEELIAELTTLKNRINNLEWTFETKFPLPIIK